MNLGSRVFLPNAIDLTAEAIHAAGSLEPANRYLNDTAALNQLYEQKGYLFFRDVLDHAAIDEARRRMIAVLAARGVVAAGTDDPVWTGGSVGDLREDSPEFAGICAGLFQHRSIKDTFAQILGESISLVPIVQYRFYPPSHPTGRPHQDGFYSPGIEGYRPVWIPLMQIDESLGGLAVAVQCKDRGFFHNLAKPSPHPIPLDLIPPQAWSRSDYYPGDVLLIHPHTPHCGLPNRSTRVRLSIDTRVQSAVNPKVVVGLVTAMDADSVTLRQDDGTELKLTIDDDTFIRTGKPNQRITLAEMQATVAQGARLMASRNGGRAAMLRRPSEF